MSLLTDNGLKLLGEFQRFSGLCQELLGALAAVIGREGKPGTFCASSSAMTLPCRLRSAKNNPRQIVNSAQASFPLTKGQLKSTIVREPFSKFQMSFLAFELTFLAPAD